MTAFLFQIMKIAKIWCLTFIKGTIVLIDPRISRRSGYVQHLLKNFKHHYSIFEIYWVKWRIYYISKNSKSRSRLEHLFTYQVSGVEKINKIWYDIDKKG